MSNSKHERETTESRLNFLVERITELQAFTQANSAVPNANQAMQDNDGISSNTNEFGEQSDTARFDALQKVFRNLLNDEVEVSTEAARTLGRIGKLPPVLLPDLIDIIRSRAAKSSIDANSLSDPFSNWHSNIPLGLMYGQLTSVIVHSGPEAIPHLRRAMFDKNQGVRLWASETLAKFGVLSVPALCEDFRLNDPADLYYSHLALIQVGEIAVPFLCEMLRDPSVLHREQVPNTLVGIKPDPPGIRMRLAAIAIDPNVDDVGHELAFDTAERLELTDNPKVESELPLASGIERMGEEAATILRLLTDFRNVGTIWRANWSEKGLSIKKIAEQLTESPTHLRKKMEDVSKFFQKYFQRHENLNVLGDEEDVGPEEAQRRKLFERVQGKTFRIYPLGMRAWELTCRYLDRFAPAPKSST